MKTTARTNASRRFSLIHADKTIKPRIHANERESKPLEQTMKYAISFFQTLLATLREIFDENAYQRFLLRTGSTASVQSYREFQRERESHMATKPRCC